MTVSRPILYLIGVFLLAFVLITVMKARQDPPEFESGTQMSASEKAQIKQFWTMYRSASHHRRAGDLEEAVIAYRKALRLHDRHEDTLYYLGNVLFQLGRYDEALDAFRRLTVVNPLSARAHFQAGAILSCAEQGAPLDLDAAEREFRRTFEINREESEPLVRLGEVALAKRAFDQAETYLHDAVRLNDKAVEAYYLLGYIGWVRGDRSGAVALFRTALSRHNQVDRPNHGVPGEGDTRDGRRLGEERQSLFTPLLKTAMEGSAERTEAQIAAAYQRLARFCNEVTRRVSE